MYKNLFRFKRKKDGKYLSSTGCFSRYGKLYKVGGALKTNIEFFFKKNKNEKFEDYEVEVFSIIKTDENISVNNFLKK